MGEMTLRGISSCPSSTPAGGHMALRCVLHQVFQGFCAAPRAPTPTFVVRGGQGTRQARARAPTEPDRAGQGSASMPRCEGGGILSYAKARATQTDEATLP